MPLKRLQCLDKLRHGDRRSIGRAGEVVRMVLKQPKWLLELVAGLWHPDTLVRMRAGDALEKVSRKRPEWVRPMRRELLNLAALTQEQGLRWHLAQLLPRLGLGQGDQRLYAAVLRRYLRDPSAIVRVSAMQGLADLAATDPSLCPLVRRQLRRGARANHHAYRFAASRRHAAAAFSHAGTIRLTWRAPLQPRDSTLTESSPVVHSRRSRMWSRPSSAAQSDHKSGGSMIAARRTTRFIAGLALTGLLLGSSPLAPGSLAASPQPSSASISAVCDYINAAIAILQTQPQTNLNKFLLAYFNRLKVRFQC
jgi:hypothetical protein